MAFAVDGVSLPGFPGVMIGHNQSVAWGITLSYCDVEDIFVERFESPDSDRYWYGGGWGAHGIML